MRNLFLSAAVSTVIAFLPGQAPAQRVDACNANWPQAGTLHLNERVRVAVFRNDRASRVEAGNGAPVCVSDFIPARPAEGWVLLLDGETLRLVANRELIVPDRRWSLLRWLRNAGRRAELFRLAGAGVLGSDHAGFALEGIETGTARIGMNHRTLIIPVNRVDATLRVELWAPGSTLVQTVTVLPGVGEAEFRGLRPQQGEWRLVIRQDPPIVGAFEMVERSGDADVDALAREARLGPREAVLALACIDPLRQGLEAYQRATSATEASREDRTRILSWRSPTAQLSCGTPTAEGLGQGR